MPQGKPFLKRGPEFNISHSGEVVVLAVASCGGIGIDIEKIRAVRIEEFTRFLPEASPLAGRSDPEALALFFDCWTQKEAVLKGHGSGLSLALEQVVLCGDVAHLGAEPWYLHKLPVAEHYCGHVASTHPMQVSAWNT